MWRVGGWAREGRMGGEVDGGRVENQRVKDVDHDDYDCDS